MLVWRGLVLLLALLLGFVAAPALAQVDTYTLPFWTIGNGGGSGAGGEYLLYGEVGRSAAQGTAASGAGYSLQGGIWHPSPTVLIAPPSQRSLWLPMVSNLTPP